MTKKQIETQLKYGLKGCEILDYAHENPYCPNTARHYIEGKFVCDFHKEHEPLTPVPNNDIKR